MRTSTVNKPNEKPIDLDKALVKASCKHQANIELVHDLKTDKITICLYSEGDVLLCQISGDELRKFAYKTEQDLQHLAENS